MPAVDRLRLLLGLTAVALGATALWAWWSQRLGLAGVSGRVSLVLAAAWVAWPSLVQASWRTFLLMAGGVGVMLWRPRAAWIVLPVLLLTLRRR